MPYFTVRGPVALPVVSETTVYGPHTLGAGDASNWRGLTFVQKFAAANLGAATGTQVRLTLKLASFTLASPGTLACWFGKAGAGDAYDFTGTQVHVLFSGVDITADGSTVDYVSDWMTLGEAYDESVNYCFAAEAVGASGVAVFGFLSGTPLGDTNYFKSGADAATTDKTGYGGNANDSAELVSTIEIR